MESVLQLECGCFYVSFYRFVRLARKELSTKLQFRCLHHSHSVGALLSPANNIVQRLQVFCHVKLAKHVPTASSYPNSRRDCAHTNSRLAFLGPACTASEMKASALARPISISSPGGGFDKIYSSKNLWITINQKPIIYRTQNSGFNLFSSLSRFFFRFSFAAPVFILC